jgi:hypothetical protein
MIVASIIYVIFLSLLLYIERFCESIHNKYRDIFAGTLEELIMTEISSILRLSRPSRTNSQETSARNELRLEAIYNYFLTQDVTLHQDEKRSSL